MLRLPGKRIGPADALSAVIGRHFSIGGRVFQPCKFDYREKLDIPPQTDAPLAGRKWLAGALNPLNKFPDYLRSPIPNLPPVYQADGSATTTPSTTPESLTDWAKAAREILDETLPRHGVALFKSLPITSGQDFSAFLQGLEYKLVGYEGGLGVRQNVADNVMTASDDVPEVTIQPHNELAYASHYPTKVIFFCEQPSSPGCGGESALTRNSDVKDNLDPEVKDKFGKLGIMYQRHLPCKTHEDAKYTSWQKVFWTDNKDDVARYMERFNNPYSWDEHNALSYSYVRPAFIKHPTTGESVWFNHSHAHHSSRLREHPSYAHMRDEPHRKFAYHATYGDGSEIEPETIGHIRDVLWQQTVGFQMQKGDVIFIDNLTTMHARLGFRGPRRLLASFAED